MTGINRFQRAGWFLGIILACLVIHPLIGAALQGIFTCNLYTGHGSVFAQQKSRDLFSPLESSSARNVTPMEGPLDDKLRESIPREGQPLEGPIDPESYRLGPGDLLAVYVLGDIEDQLLARISADGLIRISSLGVFDTRNRSFKELREEILSAAEKRYRSGVIEVSLIELRSFKASVGGMVPAPGTYELTAADRVAALLEQAGGFLNPERILEESAPIEAELVIERRGEEAQDLKLPPYSTRRLQLIHRDGSRENVDLLLFLRAGLPEGNPYVSDGDFLLIPPLNPRSGVLGVFGAVNQQCLVEFVEGDNIERALALAGGLADLARLDSVEITRFTGETSEYNTIFVNLNDLRVKGFQLEPDDRIFVRQKQNYHLVHQVELRGEFLKPGFYPITEDSTTLLDVVMKAGGFTPRASLTEAVLTRDTGFDEDDPEFERLLLTQVRDMTPLEYQYFLLKTRELQGQVAADLYALFLEGDSTQNIFLRNGDLLYVPPVSRSVKVIGQVNHPGFISYISGESSKYYVNRAGGYAWNARKGKVRVIKANSGKWLKPGKTLIEEGDTVFVPEKPYVNTWDVVKDVLLILTQSATIYLVITQATK
ncbi:hypothetical protein CEE37_09545 [candidate division LCP-89 bacterium B3_LCP]|uniref:Soluble ligand binding domain-containing protein n=1 Tax=candidate division LCP-89 bacterium B3_LCP TaxID=2012998 RepID=A0A532UYG0_UNCL8|nr:MAG: hypothetical protein CEE37_09545 [candidate division LCP-89 bacterium B3_LCP]